jgi:hypothetical protein
MKLPAALLCLLIVGCQMAPKAHWKHTPEYGGSEDFYLIRNSDGQILIDIIHGDGPDATFDLCLGNGTCEKDYETLEQAKTRALQIVRVEVTN